MIFSKKKVITLTFCDRPGYTRKTIESLSKCVGIENYVLLPFVEPVSPEVIDLVRKIKFAECRVTVNSVRLGCERNTYTALNRGFEISDFVLHIEDDVCVAPDALLYSQFCAKRFKDDPGVYTVSLFNRSRCNESQYYAVSRRPWFTPWGWGTWKSRWTEPHSFPVWDFDESLGGWDVHLNKHIRRDRCEVYPDLSRAVNIGEEGVHTISAQWHRENVYFDFWAGSPELEYAITHNAGRWRS